MSSTTQPGGIDPIAAFGTVDIRVGRIVSAEPATGARKPAYRMAVDFGPVIGTRHSSAQLTELYGIDDLIGRIVLGVVNLPPKRIAGFTSDVLVLGVPDDLGRVVLIQPERTAPLGGRLF